MTPDNLGRMAQHFEGLPDRRHRDWWPLVTHVAAACVGVLLTLALLAWGLL